MTENPNPGMGQTPPPAPPQQPDTGAQTNVYPTPPAPAAAPPPDPNAGVTAGAAAPNSEMSPGHGLPVAGGPPMSVKPKMSAAGLNIGFLVGGVIAVLLIIWLVLKIIHAL